MEDKELKMYRDMISEGSTVLGIEFGSTRIKASLITPEGIPAASGSHGWENRLDGNIWTYDLDSVWDGAASCFAGLAEDVEKTYGVTLSSAAAAGISAMMHGYLVFDEHDNPLVPFRTWRNNITGEASAELSELFQYPIPQRWSIAHLYQAILNGEEHVGRISFMTTLSGYIHWKLTGEKVIGICDASGMFPIDTETQDYDASLLNIFDRHIAYLDLPWTVRDILPEILPAGKQAGILTEAGAKLLDPSGTLKPGIPLCPPEGDAGTGMAATNSVRQRTGNVSAGTSVFAMLVLEKNLSRLHHEIDLVATPDGKPVAMAHSNNCTSDYDAWVALFAQAAEVLGSKPSIDEVYNRLLKLALEADADTGGLFHCSYVSGEHVTGFSEGRPLFVRQPGSSFTLENFMRSLLFTSLCALRTGLNILYEEGVTADEIRGHGGFFKTPEVGQRIMAAATGIPVSLLETAGEGGSWGMALLAAYMNRKDPSITLPDFLDPIFSAGMGTPAAPDPKDIEGFNAYFERYHKGLPIERAAVESLRG